ncbi:hypothetical protein Tco_0321719 [Tanacetum coccineum]
MAGDCWKMIWSDVPVVPSNGRKTGCQMRLNSVSDGLRRNRFVGLRRNLADVDFLKYSCDPALMQSTKVVDITFLFPWPLEPTSKELV